MRLGAEIVAPNVARKFSRKPAGYLSCQLRRVHPCCAQQWFRIDAITLGDGDWSRTIARIEKPRPNASRKPGRGHVASRDLLAQGGDAACEATWGTLPRDRRRRSGTIHSRHRQILPRILDFPKSRHTAGRYSGGFAGLFLRPANRHRIFSSDAMARSIFPTRSLNGAQSG